MNPIPDKLEPLFDFLADHLKTRDFCRLSNKLIGQRLNINAATISNQLTQLKKLGFIVVTKGHPVGAPFSEYSNLPGRRIYFCDHPDVQKVINQYKKTIPPHRHSVLYADKSVGIVSRHIRHHKGLGLLSKLIYTEICLVSAGGGISAPASFYATAFGVSVDEVELAFEQLYDEGVIYWIRHQSGWYYGTMVGLFENLAMAAIAADYQKMNRLKETVVFHSKFGSVKEMKSAIHEINGANVHQL